MKVFQINTFGNKSTGKIAVDIYKTLKANGHDGVIAYARNQIEEGVPHIVIGNKFDVYAHGIMTRLTDKTGFYSKRATLRLIDKIKEYDPDVIHLHNLHGYYINIEILFKYLKICGKKIIWTLHDCWAITGHCCYVDCYGCGRWKSGCYDCPKINTYPKSLKDGSRWNYMRKKELFCGVPDMTVVSVSNWLDGIVSQSYLNKYRHVVIHNGIDLDRFKPTKSDFRRRNGLEDKYIILGVASEWSARKGFEDFLRLADMLDENYRIVLVGLNDKQIKRLKPNMLGIRRTNSVRELAEIYSAADVFFNATYEDNYPTVNLESIACGTSVVTYNTGGSPEGVPHGCGAVVDKGDIDAAARLMKKGLGKTDESKRVLFDKERCFRKYIDLYK